MSSTLKRSLLVAAIVGVGIVPTGAMADHNVSPGQTCKSAEVADDPATPDDEFQAGIRAGESKGDCASRIAKGNGHGA